MECPLPKSHGHLGWGWIAGVFLTTLLVYALWTPRVLHYTQPPTGDQPYYLMTTISLVEDQDLDEADAYQERASFDRFYPPVADGYPPDFPGILAPYPLPPEGHIATTPNRPADEWYSKHGLGVSLLIIPGWMLGQALTPVLSGLTLGGDGGWPAVVFQFNLLGSLLATQVLLLAWEVTGKRWISLAVWAALAFSHPSMSYSFLIFPELPAALLIIYAFRRLQLGWVANERGKLLLVGLGIGYLPWLHSRLLPVVLILMAYGVHQWRRAQRGLVVENIDRRGAGSLLLVLVPILISGGLMAAYHCWLYGSPLPNVQDHAGFFNPLLPKDRLALLLATLGLLIDQQWGLLPYAPVFALSIVGLILLMRSRERREVGGWLLLVVLPYFLIVSAYRVWWGEWCPPARYLAPVTPLLAIPLATTLEAAGHRITYKVLYALLAVLSVAIMVAFLANLDYRTPNHTPILFNHPTGEGAFFLWLESRFGIDLKPLSPGLVPWFVEEEYSLCWRPIWASLGILGAIVSAGLLCIYGGGGCKRANPA